MVDEEFCYKVNKLYTDMYLGSGKLDPSITTRLSMIERANAVADEQICNLDIALNGNNTTPGLKSEVQDMITYVKASFQWIKGIGWFLLFACTALGLYIASLEYRHKISENDPPYKSESQQYNSKMPNIN